MTDGQSTLQTDPKPQSLLRRRWATLAGLGFAALVAFDLASRVELAPVLAASAEVYLGAAALRRPAAAWPLFFARPPRPRRLGRLPPPVNRVVVRSMAEFCLVLDTALAAAIVTVTVLQ